MKYISEIEEDQPIHDMMDEIETAYQKSIKAGASKSKTLAALIYMSYLLSVHIGFPIKMVKEIQDDVYKLYVQFENDKNETP